MGEGSLDKRQATVFEKRKQSLYTLQLSTQIQLVKETLHGALQLGISLKLHLELNKAAFKWKNNCRSIQSIDFRV